jgi:glycosyltransferase involved in cell wall biosynthesis
VQKRPIFRNLSLAGRVKVQRIAKLLLKDSHTVEVISQGEVIEHKIRIYPGFSDPQPFHPAVPIYYSSALPVRFLNGLWSAMSMLRIFQARHRTIPYDILLIYNLKPPQVICALYAIYHLRLPVILEYEDGAFADRTGKRHSGFTSQLYRYAAKKLLNLISACVAVSPRLLSQTPTETPKLLLRGVVSDEILNANKCGYGFKKNWVVFSGTHFRTVGLAELLTAWGMVDLPGWELHIAGDGEMTTQLKQIAQGNRTIVFHGLLNERENARLLSSARIGINPHDISRAPGNIFPMKIVEYLAAGTHVLTTPMGTLEAELESGITYLPDNKAETIADCLKGVIQSRRYERTAADAVLNVYGPNAVARSLDKLIRQVANGRTKIRHKDR